VDYSTGAEQSMPPGFRHLLVEFATRLSLISAQAGQFIFLFLIISALDLKTGWHEPCIITNEDKDSRSK
jgi:hypothetical protein